MPENYQPQADGPIFKVPEYTDEADGVRAFKDFADSLIDDLGGINADADREGQVIQYDLTTRQGHWTAGPVMKVVDELPGDDEDGYAEGDIVFVLGDVPKAGGGGLEGLGDWAEITAMTGDPKRYTNIMVDGVEFWAFEWTADGSLTTQAGGLAEILVVGSGGYGMSTFTGSGGYAVSGIQSVVTSNNIVVAPTPIGGVTGSQSSLGQHVADGGARSDSKGANLESNITGVDDFYGLAGQGSPRVNRGDGGANGVIGSSGVVIVRVPADKVTATGGWV